MLVGGRPFLGRTWIPTFLNSRARVRASTPKRLATVAGHEIPGLVLRPDDRHVRRRRLELVAAEVRGERAPPETISG